MKTCSKCGIPKQLSEYHKDARIQCGYRPDCKACRKPITKAYTPIAVAKMKERYNSEPDFKSKARANSRKFYRTDVQEVTEMYAVRSLKRGTNLTREDLRQFPELIEAKQAQIKLDRLIRNARH